MTTHSERVWRGDLTAVRDAERNFYRDPYKFLMHYAVALYSKRNINAFGEELVRLRTFLVKRAAADLKRKMPLEKVDGDAFVDHLDTISTHIEWISRQSSCPKRARDQYRFLARRLARKGIDLCNNGYGQHHSKSLLHLTSARTYLEEADPYCEFSLKIARSWASVVKDARQKARIYGKLGFLERKAGMWLKGYLHGVRALLYAPQVPLNVTLKNAAALLGIDR